MNRNKKVKGVTKILAIMTSLIIGIAFMPVMAFATGNDISSGYTVFFSDDSTAYDNGNPICPRFVVVDDDKLDCTEDWERTYDEFKDEGLIPDKDYTYEFFNNKEVGTATLKITGKGSYTGSITEYFNIVNDYREVTPDLNADLSYSIYTDIPGFEIGEVRIDGDTYYLTEGEDYVLFGDGEILLTSDFTTGKTGFIFDKLKNDIMFFSDPDGYTVCAKKVKCFNISNVSFYDNSPFVYNGKNKSVKVSINGLKAGRDFKVTYAKSKRSAIGKYKYTVKGIGDYTGKQSDYFVVNPKKPKSIKYAKRNSSKAMVKWGKVYNCSGYQVQLVYTDYDEETDEPYYAVYKSAFVKGNSKLTKTFKNVKKSKYSKARVRAYKTVNGTKYYSKWTYKKF